MYVKGKTHCAPAPLAPLMVVQVEVEGAAVVVVVVVSMLMMIPAVVVAVVVVVVVVVVVTVVVVVVVVVVVAAVQVAKAAPVWVSHLPEQHRPMLPWVFMT